MIRRRASFSGNTPARPGGPALRAGRPGAPGRRAAAGRPGSRVAGRAAAGDRPELAGPGRARRPRSAGRAARAGRPRSGGGDRLTTTRRGGPAAAGRGRLAVVAGPASRGGLVSVPSMSAATEFRAAIGVRYARNGDCGRQRIRPREHNLRPGRPVPADASAAAGRGIFAAPSGAAPGRGPGISGPGRLPMAAAGDSSDPRACHKSYRIWCCSPEVLRSPWLISTAGDGARINRNHYRCDESESTGLLPVSAAKVRDIGARAVRAGAERIVARISTGFRGAL